jgi:hypothetical protein
MLQAAADPLARTTANVIKLNPTDERPRRGKGTWDEFLKIHEATL